MQPARPVARDRAGHHGGEDAVQQPPGHVAHRIGDSVLAAGVLWTFAPVFDSFESGLENPRWFVIGAAAAVIALSVLADVVAVFLLRAHRWARWALLALSGVAASGGLMSAYLVGPLVVTAAAVTVIVLLLLPDARRGQRHGTWPRTSGPTRPIPGRPMCFHRHPVAAFA